MQILPARDNCVVEGGVGAVELDQRQRVGHLEVPMDRVVTWYEIAVGHGQHHASTGQLDPVGGAVAFRATCPGRATDNPASEATRGHEDLVVFDLPEETGDSAVREEVVVRDLISDLQGPVRILEVAHASAPLEDDGCRNRRALPTNC